MPVGEPVPKRTLRGMLVGAEGFTSSSTPFAVPFKLAFDASLPAPRFTHVELNCTQGHLQAGQGESKAKSQGFIQTSVPLKVLLNAD